MPYVDGPSLRERLANQGELPIQDAVRTLVEIVDALYPTSKRRFAREVHVHGRCGLAQTLIEHDLIDEYRPGTGVVVSVYRRAGSLKTGSIS